MTKPACHFELTLKVRYTASSTVKHTLKRPGIWPFNRKKRIGKLIRYLECDDCTILVAEENRPEVVEMMKNDPSLVRLFGFYLDAMSVYSSFPEEWEHTESLNMFGNFIPLVYETLTEDYAPWYSEDLKSQYLEDLGYSEDESVFPPRRIMGCEKTINDVTIEAPWEVIYSAPRGEWASGTFYVDSPSITIDEVELVQIVAVYEKNSKTPPFQTEVAITMDEFEKLLSDDLT